MNKLPSSQMARIGIVGSTVVKLGAGKLRRKAKRPFMSEQAKKIDTDKQEDEEAELLFKAITQLRGTAVKIAQMLGMETELLPERVRDELAKSYHQIPPLNRVLVQKVLLKEFGKPSQQVFDTFDDDAIAAASLGQVHRATINAGQVVAVKVQYPSIHVSIESDLKLLKKITSHSIKLLPKKRQLNKQIIETSIDEIGLRLQDEIDYRLEAENTRWFKQHLLVEGVEVPQIFDDYCTSRVITSEMLDGKHLDDWLADNPSQALRDKAAQRIYELFIFSALQLKRVHADPNPGNYLFKENGDLALIDFGCVKELGSHFVENLPSLLHAFYLNDYQAIVDAYAKIGMMVAHESNGDYEKVLRPFGEWLSEPVREPFFDFKEHSHYTHSGLELIKGMAEAACLETVEEDFIFFDRTLYGLFKIFERLEAKVYMRGHWEKLWNAAV